MILFAAGLVAHGVHEFNEVGWIPSIIDYVWDVSALVSDTSTFGQLLAALFGYNPTPSLTEMLAYGAYFVAVSFSACARQVYDLSCARIRPFLSV
jgi:high-affinity iron transporter